MKPHFLIATNTLGMGARPGEIENCKSDPKGWVKQQVMHPAPMGKVYLNEASAETLVSGWQALREDLGKNRRMGSREDVFSARRDIRAYIQSKYHNEIDLRQKQAVMSASGFIERWAWFWFNRFTVSGRNKLLRLTVGAFEREAIRPHILGRFEDMLNASSLYPTMIIYLDNENSIGPNSKTAQRRGGKHNENLAREILELHTMGVDSGYSIDDITALAMGLTGWSVTAAKTGFRTIFRKNAHQPGAVSFLGQSFPDRSKYRINDMLGFLADHKATATHIAQTLVQHFIAGPISEIAIAKLRDNFLETQGDLKQLALTLIDLDEVWQQDGWIFKRPDEYLVSVGRAFPEWKDYFDAEFTKQIGQEYMNAPGPDGWPQTGEDWITAESLLVRLNWLRQALKAIPNWINPDYFIEEALGGHISDTTRRVVSRSLPRNEQLTLALLSPEFLRR